MPSGVRTYCGQGIEVSDSFNGKLKWQDARSSTAS